jgi:phosphatidylinositol dimannoside acyltransferase
VVRADAVDGEPVTGGDLGSRASDLGYRAGWSFVRHLPEPAANRMFATAADTASRRNGRLVQQLRANLRVVAPQLTDPELADLTRRGMRSYARYWCEVFRLPEWSHAAIVDRIVTHDEHLLFEAIERGNGVVAVLGHIGNWDHLAAWASISGIKVTTVVERLRPEPLFDRFVAFRESLGIEVVPNVGDDSLSSTLQDRLRAGGVVALVADRDLSGNGLAVDYFGRTARMPVGPALLARRTGAEVVPAWSWYDGTHTHLTIEPPIPVPHDLPVRAALQQVTQQFAQQLEAVVREHPEDWHVLQRVWDDVRPAG